MREGKRSRWVESGGGPLLLLAEDLLGFWDGTRASAKFREVDASFRWDDKGSATDYDRACDVRGYVGLIEVGPGHGLVLGDEPLPTTWIQSADGAVGILVRWIAADSEDIVWRTVEELPETLDWTGGCTFAVEWPPLLLFDSAYPGDALPDSMLQVCVPPGNYIVSTSRYDPNSETALLLHRFEREAPEKSRG